MAIDCLNFPPNTFKREQSDCSGGFAKVVEILVMAVRPIVSAALQVIIIIDIKKRIIWGQQAINLDICFQSFLF